MKKNSVVGTFFLTAILLVVLFVTSGCGSSSPTSSNGGVGTGGVTPAASSSITSFSPASASVGTTVTISGTNFSSTMANNIVKFNGVVASVSAASSTSITVTVPTGATTGTISVTTGAGTSISATNFYVVPTIVSLSSATGIVTEGITIAGTGFDPIIGNNTVKFGSTIATVIAASATSLSVSVPVGVIIPTSASITVTTAAGTSNSSSFTIYPVVYALSSSANTITLISTASNTIKGSITGFASPTAMLVDPAKYKGYVVNSGNNTVSVIDLNTNMIVATISGFANPTSICIYSPTSRGYVTNQGNNTVSVIDLNTNTLMPNVTSVNPFMQPTAMVIAPVGVGFVMNQAGSVYTVNLGTNAVYGQIAGGGGVLTGMALTRNNLYVLKPTIGRIGVINANSCMFAMDLTGYTTPVGIVTDAFSKIYVTDQGAGTVSVMDDITGVGNTTIGGFASPAAIAINISMNTVYVVNQGNNTVSVINTGTNTIMANVTGFATPVTNIAAW